MAAEGVAEHVVTTELLGSDVGHVDVAGVGRCWPNMGSVGKPTCITAWVGLALLSARGLVMGRVAQLVRRRLTPEEPGL